MPSHFTRSAARRPAFAVALIGPDGAGKSSITRRLGEILPLPSRTIYMGVNLDSSALMLPTTRLILMAKRARGGRPDLTVSTRAKAPEAPRSPAKRALRSLKAGVRMTNWIAEEWFRQAVATRAQRRGEVVVFDRHFLCDYYDYDVVPRYGPRPLSARIHGFLLAHAYPRPDLVVYLDAPAEVLMERKQEGTLEFLEARRQDYLRLAHVFPDFVVVDATAPSEAVAREVSDLIVHRIDSRAQSSPTPNASTETRAAA